MSSNALGRHGDRRWWRGIKVANSNHNRHLGPHLATAEERTERVDDRAHPRCIGALFHGHTHLLELCLAILGLVVVTQPIYAYV